MPQFYEDVMKKYPPKARTQPPADQKCVLENGETCPCYVGAGSGKGLNRTVICRARANNGSPAGEASLTEARACLEQKKSTVS